MNVASSNLPALAAAFNLDRTQDLLDRSLTRLSSGSQLTGPGDDPAAAAALAASGAESRRVTAAADNVQNAISYVQAADGGLASLTGVVSRLDELAALAQDPAKSPADVALYAQEFQGLQDQLRATIGGPTAEIGGTSDVASPLGSFNGAALYGATASGGTAVTLGAAGEAAVIPDTDLRSGPVLALFQQDGSGRYTLDLAAPDAGARIADALQGLGAARAALGGTEARLGLAASGLAVQGQNLTAAISDRGDADVAQESTRLAKYTILAQSGAAMLAQANQDPRAVLQLLPH